MCINNEKLNKLKKKGLESEQKSYGFVQFRVIEIKKR
jgi:hypothetical protein